jgi:uncharacterized lipoprotein NlpE involved in copper resistance
MTFASMVLFLLLAAQALGQLPASFCGDLPCADCPGIRYQLNLFPDRVFFMRMTYLGRDESFDDLGTWIVSPDEKTLLLQGGREAPDCFAIKDEATLRKLDLAGHEIASALNYDLKRAVSLQLIEPRGSMTGMYRSIWRTQGFSPSAGLAVVCRSHRSRTTPRWKPLIPGHTTHPVKNSW